MKTLLFLIIFFGLNLVHAEKYCESVSCHGPSDECAFVSSENPHMCPADIQLGDGACQKFLSCKVVRGKCQTVKQAGADPCISCYNECKKSIDVAQTSLEKEWTHCMATCAKKKKLSL